MKLLATAALAVSLAVPAVAQQSCGPRAVVETTLTARYGESVIEERFAEHPAKPGVMITFQIWRNVQTGTWTFTGYADDGGMCAYAFGKRFSGQKLDDFLNPGTDT